MIGGDSEIPQWKKDLIARLRSQNKRTATAAERQHQQQQLFTHPLQSQRTSALVESSNAVQQPGIPPDETVISAASTVRDPALLSLGKCDKNQVKYAKMVQQQQQETSCLWETDSSVSGSDKSDSSEDLRYGPGIVNKLKNKYLSLALRESNNRASILPLRKAASLENILDGDDVTAEGSRNRRHQRLFQSRTQNGATTDNDVVLRNPPSRYRNPLRGPEMKRARSVEVISRNVEEARPKRESMYENILIKDGNDTAMRKCGGDKNRTADVQMETTIKHYGSHNKVNRPKRIAPIMNEREKPPVDVVRQAKLIFERRPDQRTRPPPQTGEVAAKVATYKSIIIQAKNTTSSSKKPPTKAKPTGLSERFTNKKTLPVKHNDNNKNKKSEVKQQQIIVKQDLKVSETVEIPPSSLPSPIPDISRIGFPKTENDFNSKQSSLTETPDLIATSSPPHQSPKSLSYRISTTENFIKEEIRHSTNYFPATKTNATPSEEGVQQIDAQSLTNINNESNTVTYNFAENQIGPTKNVLHKRTPPLQPLKLEILNGHTNGIKPEDRKVGLSPIISPSSNNWSQIVANNETTKKPTLTALEMEKNLINKSKTLKPELAADNNGGVLKLRVPKVKKPAPREAENNSVVFKFTDRKDVPDYVHNDGTTRAVKIEKPKVGEGGIILLPGASIDESFTDEDEEIMLSLNAPPSPCDVVFINDNILIDGKSSLSQKSKKVKMKISFVDEGPEVYEYPSETSLIEDLSPSPINAQVGHSVPLLSGSSSLASYTPKSTGEDFQPGVTRTLQQNIPSKTDIPATTNNIANNESTDEALEELEQPILFSAGANSDILF